MLVPNQVRATNYKVCRTLNPNRRAGNEGWPLFAGQKLLVADDSPYYRTVIGLTFTDEGMEVTTVSDGQAALEQLEQSTPDAILTSAYMPGISGSEPCGLLT